MSRLFDFRSATGSFAVAAITWLVLATPPPALWAQTGEPNAPVAIKMDPSKIEIHTKRPMTCEEFELRDPETGEPIDEDFKLLLPNGKRIQAKKYYDALNKHEQKLCAMGYSLRTDEPVSILQTSRRDLNRLQTQNRRFMRSFEEFDAVKLPPDDEQIVGPLETLSGPGIAEKIRELESTTTTPSTKRVVDRPWIYDFGDPDTFSTRFVGSLKLTGGREEVRIDATGDVIVTLFNYKTTVFSSDGMFKATGSKATVNLSASAYDQANLVDVYEERPTRYWLSETKSKYVEKSVVYSFTLGPIPMTARFGARGNLGIYYYVDVNAFYVSAKATVKPFGNLEAYGSVEINVGVGGAGVKAGLKLIDVQLTSNANLKLLVDGQTVMLSESYNGFLTLTAMKGYIYAYVYIYVPRWGYPPYKKKEYRWDIFEWSGASRSGTIFYDNRTTRL